MYKGERFNSITHLIGAVLAIAGLSLLVVQAARQGDPWKIVSSSIYGATLVILYSFSTLYHSNKGRAKKLFQICDHLSIYLLIAGTYTPLTLVTIRGGWGWSIFGVIWGLALLGITLEVLMKKRSEWLAVLIYILMGWLIIIASKPLVTLMPSTGLFYLALGGIFYTSGVFFYIRGGRVRHFHGIWHLFVLAGSFCHFCTIMFYLR